MVARKEASMYIRTASGGYINSSHIVGLGVEHLGSDSFAVVAHMTNDAAEILFTTTTEYEANEEMVTLAESLSV